MRWLPEAKPRRALTATAALAGLVLVADIAIIAVYARSDIAWRPLAVIAVAASLARIACSITTLGRSTTMRHALTDHTPPAAEGSDGHR